MKKGFVLSYTLIFLTLHITIFAHQNNTTNESLQKKHKVEKRSTIVDANGYVFLSEDKTIRQIREEALTEAKRQALEQGRIYIKSVTQVENYELTYDLIFSEAEGYLKILDHKDYGIESDNRYHYWIKAEIEYKLKETETSTKSTLILQNPAAPLTIDVWTEKANYVKGEEIQIFLKGNKPFYARVVYIDAQGKIVQLLPNKYRQLNFFRSDTTYTIPDLDDRFKLLVRPPFGREQVIVYASSNRQAALAMKELNNGLYQYQYNLAELGMQVRGIEITESTVGSQCVEFYEANWNLITNSHIE